MKYESTKEELFDSIYRSYAKDVYYACLHLTCNEDLAQEMTQQAFVNFYERFEEVNVECVKAYLIKSAQNLTYNYYRDTKKEVWNDEDDERFPQKEEIVDGVEEQYFQELKRTMAKELTTEILVDLQENHQNWYEIIYMMFILDESHDEIAEKLEISKDVLYSRLHRAKLWIRKKYKKDFDKVTATDE